MPPPVFPQHGRKIVAVEAESLLDSTRYSDPGIATRHAIAFAEDPYTSSAVIHFEGTGSHRAKRAHHPTGDGDFPVCKPPWIMINAGNTLPRRTAGKDKHGAS